MATLSAYVSGRTVNWLISGFQNNFNSTYYIAAGITLTPFDDGEIIIVDIVDTVYAEDDYAYKYIGGSYENANVGTYTIYGWAQIVSNGLFYNAGTYEITVLEGGIVKVDLVSGFINAVPYIDTPSGWVAPEVWIDTPSGWVKTIG